MFVEKRELRTLLKNVAQPDSFFNIYVVFINRLSAVFFEGVIYLDANSEVTVQ